MKVKAYIDDDQTCNLCGEKLVAYPVFYDASVPRLGGKWGWLCKPCFEDNGCSLGTGCGQEYNSSTKEKQRG